MAFIARKPFKLEGRDYQPGEEVDGFPERFVRSEAFLRAGLIREIAEPKPKRRAVARKKSQPKVETDMEQVFPVEIEV